MKGETRMLHADYIQEPVWLEYNNGTEWIRTSEWPTEELAWMSLGDDNVGYRTVSKSNGTVVREN